MDFNSVLIGSEDPAQLVAYYTKLFGEPAFTDGGYSGWQIGSGWITIGPHSEVKGRSREPGRSNRCWGTRIHRWPWSLSICGSGVSSTPLSRDRHSSRN